MADVLLGILIIVLVVSVAYIGRFVSRALATEVLEMALVPLIYVVYHRYRNGPKK